MFFKDGEDDFQVARIRFVTTLWTYHIIKPRALLPFCILISLLFPEILDSDLPATVLAAFAHARGISYQSNFCLYWKDESKLKVTVILILVFNWNFWISVKHVLIIINGVDYDVLTVTESKKHCSLLRSYYTPPYRPHNSQCWVSCWFKSLSYRLSLH